MRPFTALRPALRLGTLPRPSRPALTQTRQSSSFDPSSLDALFQSPKLKANPAFARQVRKKVSEYRAAKQQGAEGTHAGRREPGRHPLDLSSKVVVEQPLQTIHQQSQPSNNTKHNTDTQVQLYASHLVFSPPDSGSIKAKKHLPISYTHLRDSCTCHQCIQPSTLQKLLKAGQAYEELRPSGPAGAVQLPAVQIETRGDGEQGLTITWVSGHQSWFSFPHLIALADPEAQPVEQTPKILATTEWSTRETLVSSPTLRIAYTDYLSSPSAQHAFLAQLVAYGLVILTGLPTADTSDQGCEMRKAMQLVGELRNTFYGATWDVKAVSGSRNIAYTDVDLGFHQDLCYFENPPRFQALHCLRNRVQGGSSYFTDSFATLRHMLKHHPEQYAVLKRADVPFVYDNDGVWYHRFHKTVEEATRSRPPSSSSSSNADDVDDAATAAAAAAVQFHAVNYSPPFQAPFPAPSPAHTPGEQDKLFAALALFERLLAREEGLYEFTLREGEMVVFDNRRVLHARRAFRNKEEEPREREEGGSEGVGVEGEPTRWLKGCYLDGDVVWNKMRVMNRLVRTGEVEPLPQWKEVLQKRGLLE
ncbi:hypothetical protein QFC22_004977 [Naganishia vaughanmartiniae]|uniref:Uncharacterized protein n=1 Tax=Naganishia vaughanmartiniae TaxID=1424756 RepID=A0ACC2WWY4_9TREE|nr:hypothetical protein QFC22_004977 [Naganishia vaughanmartiniae]